MGAVLRVTVGGKTVTHDLERLRANGLNMRPALERVRCGHPIHASTLWATAGEQSRM